MKVKLIAATQPLDMKVDELVAYCARVSNPSNQHNHDSSGKLLGYLVKHEHWSPFEMVNVVMEIETTRDIARQILRHRSFSFQEFSQRYAEVTNDMYEVRETRLQDEKNRQNSIENEDAKLADQWEALQERAYEKAFDTYTWALKNGIAKEVARSVLPEGMTKSRMYMNGTLRSWIHYCQLRMGNGTQKEHREIAVACWGILCSCFPFLSEMEL